MTCCTADRNFVDPDGRQSNPDRHGLPLLAACPDPFIQLQIMPYHGNPGENVRTAADQGRAFDRFGDLPVFDQVGFTGREDELPVGDVDLAAAERDGIQSLVDLLDDIFRL